ncbi:T9SS type A sorting domain-containing protein [bacterium]|nr:T9SS type A sorting domain-containing protein [bacterium]
MKYRYLILNAIFVMAILHLSATATPYWTEKDFQAQQADRAISRSIERFTLQPATDDSYALLFEYVQICDFLASMQELNPSNPEYGGMHEGETPELWAIVQTDNTQEAIRVWSTFGQISGDLETYRLNIEAAWEYTMNFPAYDEEGDVSDYYRVHNCGWGLVAETKYREVYADDSHLWYADSCAWYIKNHRLGYSGFGGFYDSLHPLVEGWGAGTLYDYGIEQSDPEAVNHALEVGGDVQTWISADTSRLNDNEAWAMSGGTAMWGVCRSVFVADPAAGQAWLPTVLPAMDTYAGLGEWNNSWNVWYAHAYHAAAAVSNDPTLTGLAYALVDTLLDADTDHDGGIMATSTDPVTADQSWVSCYLDYMGMEAFILDYPDWDAGIIGFIEPSEGTLIVRNWPYDITVLVGNTGLEAFGAFDISATGDFQASSSGYLEFAGADSIHLGEWIPASPGYASIFCTISPGGERDDNDTLRFEADVKGWGGVEGIVTDAFSNEPITATLYFYRDNQPDEPMFTVGTDPLTGLYEIEIVEGNYHVVIEPEIPYTSREVFDVEVIVNENTYLGFELIAAPILLVDDDGGEGYESYYSVPLLASGFDAYRWNTALNGEPESELNLFSAVIWFTGNETTESLTSSEQMILEEYLDAGGNLLLTGQNIAETCDGSDLLSDYLGAALETGNAYQQQVAGIIGDPVTNGMLLSFPGAGGAGNQTSTDAITITGPGIMAMEYFASPNPGAAVRVEDDYKSLFLGFGLEGVAGMIGNSRQEFLDAVLDWFEVPPTGIEEAPSEAIPETFQIVSLYPNPFNPIAQIQFDLPVRSLIELLIYNVLGELVDEVTLGMMNSGRQAITYTFPVSISSGSYFLVLNGEDFSGMVQGTLIK